MSYCQIKNELDAEQAKASVILSNSVVAAGAGSGKTKVLAARYAYLVLEKGYAVDEILTLTFTKKAVTEMYSRIYNVLADSCADFPAAETAVKDFYKAKIFTIDSYCTSIARTASRRYGITPDFTVDAKAVREIAENTAIPFVLEHRKNQAISEFLVDNKIEDIAQHLFAEPILEYSTITRPIDFKAMTAAQIKETAKVWAKSAASIAGNINAIQLELSQSRASGVLFNNITNFFATHNDKSYPEEAEIIALLEHRISAAEEEQIRQHILRFCCVVHDLTSIKPGSGKDPFLCLVSECIKQMRIDYSLLVAAAAYCLQFSTIESLFALLDEFQFICQKKKREAGIMTFADIANLAVDALSTWSDIRQNEKQRIKAIMIDEFQDNNDLQRDLLFLLAENLERTAPGVPQPQELCPEKLFFVGDEKQSIYRFRGADVSVFRKLNSELKTAQNTQSQELNLSTNYRSHPDLICIFNALFGGFELPSSRDKAAEKPQILYQGVFLRPNTSGGVPLPLFEASYTWTKPFIPPCSAAAQTAPYPEKPRISIYTLNKAENKKKDMFHLSDEEIEAVFVAAKIKEIVESGFPVRCRLKDGTLSERPCRYEDITVLFKVCARQHLLEKHLRAQNIPYASENIAGFFADAPVNDLYAMLRLSIYPDDTNAYAVVLSSPFVRLNKEDVLICLLQNGSPFSPETEPLLSAAGQKQFSAARRLYQKLCEATLSHSICELLSLLWYEEGYRYETVHSPRVVMYGELYDYLFELARQADLCGQTLASFLDTLSTLMKNGKRLDDMDIPVERVSGVHLMTIHKSKGLEFPIVFLYDSASGKKCRKDDRKMFYADKTNSLSKYDYSGVHISLNLPDTTELPDSTSNLFYKLQEEESNKKEIAERRRLLYVALTRAESAVFITGAKSAPKKEEEASLLANDLCEEGSLYDFLMHAASPFKDSPFFVFGEIPVINRLQLPNSAHFKTEQALYDLAHDRVLASEKKLTPIVQKPYKSPSLFQLTEKALQKLEASGVSYACKNGEAEDCTVLDELIARNATGNVAADFGTMAHQFIEAALTGTDQRIPASLLSTFSDKTISALTKLAEKMKQHFLESELGQEATKASWLRSEFPFKSIIGNTILNGKIDLLFETEENVTVVDFKADAVENVQNHIAQLHLYQNAVCQLRGKPVRCFLYYLRSGHAVDVSSATECITVEDYFAGE